jgi:hypothetical protein
MKCSAIVIVSLLVVAVLSMATLAHEKQKLCGDQLNNAHNVICKPHTGLHGRKRRSADDVKEGNHGSKLDLCLRCIKYSASLRGCEAVRLNTKEISSYSLGSQCNFSFRLHSLRLKLEF